VPRSINNLVYRRNIPLTLGISLVCFSIQILTACLGSPVPLSRRDRAASGEERKLDLTFIQAGKTSRAEVNEKIGWMDTGYRNPHVFWGRWSSSTLGYWVVVGGPGGAEDLSRRVWGLKNLIISFDQNGLVRDSQLSDETELIRMLHQTFVETEAEPLDLTQSLTFAVEYRDGRTYKLANLSFGPDSIVVQGVRRSYVNIAPTQISEVRPPGPMSQDVGWNLDRPGATERPGITLLLSEKSRRGKEIILRMPADALATLILFLNEKGSAKLKWN
jgi:hypothetical protein